MLGRALPRLNRVFRNISRRASSKVENTGMTKKADVPLQQSPNYPSTWSTSQRPRPGLGSNPRFEQTAIDLQPNPLSAMELVSEEPIRLVHGRKAICDGGGGPLGHPKIYINLDRPEPRACGYCGIRFKQEPHHH